MNLRLRLNSLNCLYLVALTAAGCASTGGILSEARARSVTRLATTTSCQNPLIIRDIQRWGQKADFIPESKKLFNLRKYKYNTDFISHAPTQCTDKNLVSYVVPQAQFDLAKQSMVDKGRDLPEYLSADSPPILVVRHMTAKEVRNDPRVRCRYEYLQTTYDGVTTKNKTGEECRYVY